MKMRMTDTKRNALRVLIKLDVLRGNALPVSLGRAIRP